MKVEIKEKKDNNLLKRVEVKGSIDYEGVTPTNSQLVEALSKELKKDASLVIIKNIHSQFSQQKADFFAFVYESEEAKNKTEMLTKHMKKKIDADKKKAEEAAAEAKEEAKKAEEESKKEAEPVEEAPKEEVAPAEEKKEGEE
jgi:ribosomal protein S24E